jgi:putative SOS response-associated peptidase YedK
MSAAPSFIVAILDNGSMCARFTLRRPLNVVMKELADSLPVGLFDYDPKPAYNIAPTQKVAAVRATADVGRNELVPLKWGLSRVSWKLSCAVLRGGTGGNTGPLLDTGKPGKKQPWHFHLHGDKPFAFAGLWECWKPPEGEPVKTCVIVTTAANELAAKYHDRMPVIVDSGDYARWLDPSSPADKLAPLLECRFVGDLEVAAANPLVNNPRNQGPQLLIAQA